MNQAVATPFLIRPCTAEDEPAILELLTQTVGATEASRKTSEFWNWKHVQSPFGRSYSVCAIDESTQELAGLRTLMWWTFHEPGGSESRAVRPVDTATHPAHQRRGIFSTLTKYAVDELTRQQVPFIFNTPNANSLPGYLKMGWEVVAQWPVYRRFSRRITVPWEILRSMVSAGPPTDDVEARGFMTWAQFRELHGGDVAEIVKRHEGERRSFGYRTVRDLAYLDWRYGGHPDVVYLVFPLRDRTGLTGFMIGRRTTRSWGPGTFVVTEMFLREPTVSAGVALLRAALRRNPDPYMVAHFAAGTIELEALKSAGFFTLPKRGYTFAARALGRCALDPANPAAWDLTLGELEIF